MLNFSISGLDQLSVLPELFAAIHGMGVHAYADSSGRYDQQLTIRNMEAEVDHRLSPFSGSPVAQQFADAVKQQLRQEIIRRGPTIRSANQASSLTAQISPRRPRFFGGGL